jgi:hypothetical protein
MQASLPADSDATAASVATKTCRWSTALLQESEEKEGEFVWMYVHETWMPLAQQPSTLRHSRSLLAAQLM